MSKAFTKDDSGGEPLLVLPRAPLPPGIPNYVTPRGLELLRAEHAELEAERVRLGADEGDEAERRSRRAVVGARLSELAARIASAAVVEARGQSPDEVRFGATVTLLTLSGARPGEERRFRIVGVDEADPARGSIAFVAPIARAVLGCAKGDVATLETARGEEELEITAIEYTAD